MKKILIIEDDPLIRENIFEVLELNNYKTFIAANGKEGVDLALQILPDLIICDIMMPLMDGFEVKEELSKDPRTKFTPFIFLTAKAETKEIRHGMALGADDYITKPFEIADLLNSIQIRFNKIEGIRELYKLEMHESGNKQPPKNKILITSHYKTHLVSLDEIVYIHSEGNYSEIFLTENKNYLIRQNLKYWEEHLTGNNFLRIHQSYIINTGYLEKIEKISSRECSVKIKHYNGLLPVSQRQIPNLKKFFS